MANYPLPSNVGHIKPVSTNGTSAGLEIADSIPTGYSWVLLAVQHTLHKGGTGTPQVALQICDSAGNPYLGPFLGCSGTQNVNTTVTYTWAPGLPLAANPWGSGTSFYSTAPLPHNLTLPGGHQIQTLTLNSVGGTSSYGTPSYFVCELGTGK